MNRARWIIFICWLALFTGWLLFVAIVSTDAAEIIVNENDQNNIQSICDLAARSGDINRDQRLQIVSYCVNWAARVQDANRPKATADTATTEKK